jgi:hypothetical protein
MSATLPTPVYQLGPDTLAIDRSQFHGPIRTNVLKRMQEKLPQAERGLMLSQVGRRATADQRVICATRMRVAGTGDVAHGAGTCQGARQTCEKHVSG